MDGSRVKGNGYRSMLFLLSCVLQPLHNALQKAAKERGGVFYTPVDHYNTISSYCRALQVRYVGVCVPLLRIHVYNVI